MGEMYGYARVSSRDQNLDRQLIALAEFGVDASRVFADKASGKDFDRPEYRKLMRALGKGDVLVVKSIDRLGRDYEEILEEWRAITKGRDAAIVVLDMPLLDTRERAEGITSVLISDIVLQLLSYVAQVECESIKQHQAEGIAAAQARGVRFGRPRKKRPGCYRSVKAAYLEGSLTRKRAADRMHVCVSTFARWMKEDAESIPAAQEAQKRTRNAADAKSGKGALNAGMKSAVIGAIGAKNSPKQRYTNQLVIKLLWEVRNPSTSQVWSFRPPIS